MSYICISTKSKVSNCSLEKDSSSKSFTKKLVFGLNNEESNAIQNTKANTIIKNENTSNTIDYNSGYSICSKSGLFRSNMKVSLIF